MSRILSALGVGLIGIGAWIAGRRARDANQLGAGVPPELLPAELPPVLAPPAPEPLPPAVAPAPPAFVRSASILSPLDVVALVDPGYGVTPAEALAYVEVESSFNPRAYRFEHHLGEASWGLMQVLETTARDRGLVGPPDQMFAPEIGMPIGLAHVAWTREFLAGRGAPDDPLSVALAYNAGVGNALRGRVSSDYRRKWSAALERWRGRGFA